MIRWVRHTALCAVLSLSLSLGCTTALDRAQAGTTASARVVHSVDLELAQRYAARASEVLQDAMSLEDYRDKMQGWDRVEQSLRLTKAALLAMQAAIDVWEATGEDPGFRRVAACFLSQARTMVRIVKLAAPDLDLSSIESIAPLLSAFAGGVCHE